jgi:hypothetical protein
MWHALFEAFLGCAHTRTTFPMTPRIGSGSGRRGGTYVVCLDCGTEFAYDWREMKMGARIARSQGTGRLGYPVVAEGREAAR